MVGSRSSKLGYHRVGEVKCPSDFCCCWCVCFDHVPEVGAGIVKVACLKRRVGVHEVYMFL